MNTTAMELEMLDLEPFRMPTSTLEEIDRLSIERRQVLHRLSASPQEPGLKSRLSQIDGQLEELWNQRRLELRRNR